MIERIGSFFSALWEFIVGFLAIAGEFLVWLFWNVLLASGYGLFATATILLFLLWTPARTHLEKTIYPALAEFDESGIENLKLIGSTAKTIRVLDVSIEHWTSSIRRTHERNRDVVSELKALQQTQIELLQRMQALVDEVNAKMPNVRKADELLAEVKQARAERRRRESPGEYDDLLDGA